MSIKNETVLNVYRSCQEIINNINKHSQAQKVFIKIANSLTEDTSQLKLCYN